MKKSDRQQTSDDWTELVNSKSKKVTEKQYKAAVDLLADALEVTQKSLLQIYNWPENIDNAAMVYPIIEDNRFILKTVRDRIPK